MGKSSTRPQRRLLLGHKETKLEGLLLGRGGIFDLGVTVSSRKAFYSLVETPPTRPRGSRVGKSSIQPQRHLLLGHKEAKLEGLPLGHRDVSDLAMTVSSWKAFYSATAMPPTHPWGSEVKKSST